MGYYNGTKLLSLKDLNGNTPEIFIACNNRTSGKTTFFNRLCVNRFLKTKRPFVTLVRKKLELEDLAEAFFGEIQRLFFRQHAFTQKIMLGGNYVNLYMDDNICGYGLPINAAGLIKKRSHLFNTCSCMFLDEFQEEYGNYCKDEVGKVLSIHYSLARGEGQQSRYLPLYMCGNPYTILNPYYTELGVSKRLNKNTKFLRGEGWVVEHTINKSAQQAQANSVFNNAFKKHRYLKYANDGIYLDDNFALVENIRGVSTYVATYLYKQKAFAIREYPEIGIYYCSENIDKSFPTVICTDIEDITTNA